MSASPAVRILRAAVFAGACVLLAAAGHGLSTGRMPPLGAGGAAFFAVFLISYVLGGRERSLPAITAAMLTTQAALHVAFEAALSRPATPATTPMAGMPMPHHAAGTHTTTHQALLAHLVAALVASWWLRRGEAALWSLLRRAATLVPGLAAWWQAQTGALPAPPYDAGVPRERTAGPRSLRQTLLRHAVSRRGPPTADPYSPSHQRLSTSTEFRPCPPDTPPSAVPCAGPLSSPPSPLPA